MAYSKLRLQNYRSYEDSSFSLNGGVNIVVGPNGSGKTNLLEAIYILSLGSSFRVADKDLLMHGKDWFRIDGQWQDQERTLTLARSDEAYEKQYVLDGSKRVRLGHSQRVPAVLFEPDHLRLLKSSPSGRRDYLDALCAKLIPDFTWLKHQFLRTLLQRNNLLKKRLAPRLRNDYLFAWDIGFTDLAEQVVARRMQIVDRLNKELSTVYSRLAGATCDVQMVYNSTAQIGDYKAHLLRLLSRDIEKDQARGFTGCGPQRDDFMVTLNGSPASSTASRGEVRSIILSLKIIELEMLNMDFEHSPLLLLDDVFSELDSDRRRALAELSKNYQTIITTTDADAIIEHFKPAHKIIRVGG